MKLVIKERQIIAQATLDGQPIDLSNAVEIVVNGKRLEDHSYRFKLNDKLTILFTADEGIVNAVSTKAIKNDDKAVSPILNQELFTVTPVTGGVNITATYEQWESAEFLGIGETIKSISDGYTASCVITGFQSEDEKGKTHVYVTIYNSAENAVFNAFMWTTASPK